MKTVELHTAFAWTCDECGRDNHCHGIHFVPTPEDKACTDEDGVPDDGGWMLAPNEVTCAHCGEKFKTENHAGEAEL
jgi:hypothetical protein